MTTFINVSASPDAMCESSIKPAIEELERAFRFFASELWFKPRKIFLPLPVITIQTRGRRNALGWFAEDKWRERHADNRVSEINICAEHLRADLYDIADTLVHEMCHYANFLRGIRDTSSNGYHTKKFRQECVNVGLVCKKTQHGWSETELTPELRHLVDEIGFCEEAFRIFRGEKEKRSVEVIGPEAEEGGGEEEAEKKKEKQAKWICSCDKPFIARVAAGKEFDARCNVCMTNFTRAG